MNGTKRADIKPGLQVEIVLVKDNDMTGFQAEDREVEGVLSISDRRFTANTTT